MQKIKPNIVVTSLILFSLGVLTSFLLMGKPNKAEAPSVQTPKNAQISPVATSTLQTAIKTKVAQKPTSVATPAPDKAKLEAYLTRVGGDPGLAGDYLAQAEASGIDWRLLPAIAQQESTSGAHYPLTTNNLWGYGCPHGVRCYISSNGSNLEIFTSIGDGITIVSHALGHVAYYAGKDTYHKLQAYNGNPGYPERIISIMNSIAK